MAAAAEATPLLERDSVLGDLRDALGEAAARRGRFVLTIAEYEAIREAGTRFVVAPTPDHVDTSIENVVDMSTRYWIVERTDEAGAAAEAADPRHD